MGYAIAAPAIAGHESFSSLYLCRDGASLADSRMSFAWLGSARLHAAGSYEEAAVSYSKLLQGGNEGQVRLAPEDAAFVVARTAEAFAAVSDWSGLETWLTQNEVGKATFSVARLIALAAVQSQLLLCSTQLAFSGNESTRHLPQDQFQL